jgi:2-polyprenyl-6-hydroxyphenyl methylase/3-demethylubiquinone-9 3-methyltransferase
MGASSRAWFDEVAPGFAEYSQSAAYRQRVDAFIEGAEAAPRPAARSPRCLDLGCGTGGLSLVFAAHGFDVVGIDASPEMLRHARTAAERAGLSITFLEGDVTAELPELEADPDLIICSSVLEYVERPTEVIERCAARLAPGGVLLISVPNWKSLPRRWQQVRYALLRRRTYLDEQRTRASASELARSGEAAGLELLGTTHFSAPRSLERFSKLPFIGTLTLVAWQKRR